MHTRRPLGREGGKWLLLLSSRKPGQPLLLTGVPSLATNPQPLGPQGSIMRKSRLRSDRACPGQMGAARTPALSFHYLLRAACQQAAARREPGHHPVAAPALQPQREKKTVGQSGPCGPGAFPSEVHTLSAFQFWGLGAGKWASSGAGSGWQGWAGLQFCLPAVAGVPRGRTEAHLRLASS